jgi:deoxycytidylate deaminase
MDQAVNVARLSASRQRHGALIVKGGRVLAVGINSDRNHPSVCSDPRQQASICAERAAIRACDGLDLRGAIIYSARVTKRGVGLARPCERCEAAILEAGIKRVFWTV